MAIILTDEQIDHLLSCPKNITNPGTRWKEQSGSRQKNYDVHGEDGDRFSLFLRQNLRIQEHYSCGLRLIVGGKSLTLTRYNGSDHIHRNPIEGDGFKFQCHVHRATERYIASGRKPEHYATATDRYHDLDGALLALVNDCNITGLTLVEASDAMITLDLFDGHSSRSH